MKTSTLLRAFSPGLSRLKNSNTNLCGKETGNNGLKNMHYPQYGFIL
jgi:hypothetical protein